MIFLHSDRIIFLNKLVLVLFLIMVLGPRFIHRSTYLIFSCLWEICIDLWTVVRSRKPQKCHTRHACMTRSCFAWLMEFQYHYIWSHMSNSFKAKPNLHLSFHTRKKIWSITLLELPFHWPLPTLHQPQLMRIVIWRLCCKAAKLPARV